jgi:hypothetical protein
MVMVELTHRQSGLTPASPLLVLTTLDIHIPSLGHEIAFGAANYPEGEVETARVRAVGVVYRSYGFPKEEMWI